MQIMCKKELRKKFRQIRMDMSQTERENTDAKVFERVVATDAYKSADVILAYVSSYIEVDTYKLIEHSWQMGKKVCVPRCKPYSNDMEFFEINSFDDLEQGAFGIYEPKGHCTGWDNRGNTCCIVPALSYDKRGFRLGFGKGFYDKFLTEFNGVKLGICYENCMSEQLPDDEYDISVDLIVTDKSTLKIKQC